MGFGIGAVLSQETDKQHLPILFFSRKLTVAEHKYSTVEKEALAGKWAVGLLQYYLLHNLFQLFTDHKTLKWMASVKEHNVRILRWYLALLSFAFTVHHHPRDRSW